RYVDQGVAQAARLQGREHDVAAANLRVAVGEGGEQPGFLEELLDVRREVGDGGRASRQLIQRGGNVVREPGIVDLEGTHDSIDVGVLVVHDLRQPVHELYVGVSAHLAEHHGAFHGLIY